MIAGPTIHNSWPFLAATADTSQRRSSFGLSTLTESHDQRS